MRPSQSNFPDSFDVLVVGGGVAGLSAAVALGRSLRRVLVVDGGRQRNLPAAGAHNVLGREGVSPAQLIADGREEAQGYGVEFRDSDAETVRRDETGEFRLTCADGVTVTGRRLILATGLIDQLPAIEGVAQAWGHGVLHCPFCHGYEVRGQRIGIIASAAATAVHQSLLFSRLSDTVELYVRDVDLDGPQRAEIDAAGVQIVEGDVERLVTDARDVTGVVVDGAVRPVDAVVVATTMVARSDLYEQLGGQTQEHPFGRFIPADPSGATPIDGVWAAGNASDLAAMVAAAAGAGVMAGAAVHGDLATAEVRAELARRAS